MDVMSAYDSSDEELNLINEEEFGLNYDQINENESEIVEEFDENQKLNKMVKNNYRFDQNNEKNGFIYTFDYCKYSVNCEQLMISHIKQHISCEPNRKTSDVFNDKSIDEKKISPKMMTSNEGLGSLKYLGHKKVVKKKLPSKESNMKRGFFARKADQLSRNNENNENNTERQMNVMSTNDSSVEELDSINAEEFEDFINTDSNDSCDPFCKKLLSF
jgi:hypothetical protein